MPKPYYVLVGYLSGLSIMLMVIVVSTLLIMARAGAHTNPLPHFEKYELNSRFDLRACTNYTELEYGSSWYQNGPMGYCTLTDYLPAGITQVSVMLHADWIDTVTIRVTDNVKLTDFLATWGNPVKINHWGITTQYNWVGRKIYIDHLDGGSVDNIKIRYIYFWQGGA